MTTLVTGGAGFIGSHVCEALLKQGEQVVCIDNFNNYYSPKRKQQNVSQFKKNFTLIKGDIIDYDLENLFSKNKITKVIHLAARAGVRPSISQPLLYANVNINGTIRLLEAARKTNCKNFISASSSSVYGNQKKVPFSETDNVDSPISQYAATKKAGELLSSTYNHLYKIPITCLRFFTVYGPKGRPDMAPMKFTMSIDRGEKIPVYGDGNQKRDFTYVENIVAGIISAHKKCLDFEIINLGNNHPEKLKDLIKYIELNLNKKAKILYQEKQPGDVDRTFADVKKAKKLLGYKPTTSLKQGVKKMISWYKRENPIY